MVIERGTRMQKRFGIYYTHSSNWRYRCAYNVACTQVSFNQNRACAQSVFDPLGCVLHNTMGFLFVFASKIQHPAYLYIVPYFPVPGGQFTGGQHAF